jgi:hypothetical protein
MGGQEQPSMPRCIVCREYFDLGTVCTRCQSDNARWIAWQKNEPVEQGGLRGLLFFTEQYFHLPLLVVFTSLAFGLMATAGIWQMIRLPVCLLVVTATTLINLTIAYEVYDDRHKARERELLAQFRATIRKKGPRVWLSPQLQSTLIPAIVVGAVALLAYAIVSSDLLRAVLQWLLFEPAYRSLDPDQVSQLAELKAKAEQALPIVLLIGYIGGSFALTYFSSMLLSGQYTSRMNDTLPHPIFLQGGLLARVVQEEAQRHLSREPRSSAERQPLPQSRGHVLGRDNSERETAEESQRWTWEELERTANGGIKLRAQEEPEQSKTAESSTEHRLKYAESPSYTIEADRWGRIIRVTRDVEAAHF